MKLSSIASDTMEIVSKKVPQRSFRRFLLDKKKHEKCPYSEFFLSSKPEKIKTRFGWHVFLLLTVSELTR